MKIFRGLGKGDTFKFRDLAKDAYIKTRSLGLEMSDLDIVCMV